MDERTAGYVAAGRELARRLPWWTVWYGEHTRRFWAVPRVGWLSAAPHIEAATPQELERAARDVERAIAERGTPPCAEPPSSGTPHGGVPPHGDPPYGDLPYGDPPYGVPPAGEAVPFEGGARGGPPGTRNPPGRAPGTPGTFR